MAKPTTTTLLPSTTIQYADLNGSVTYSGSSLNTCTTCPGVDDHLDREGEERARATSTRTLRRAVTVRGLNVGADGSSWSRFYDNDSDRAA